MTFTPNHQPMGTLYAEIYRGDPDIRNKSKQAEQTASALFALLGHSIDSCRSPMDLERLVLTETVIMDALATVYGVHKTLFQEIVRAAVEEYKHGKITMEHEKTEPGVSHGCRYPTPFLNLLKKLAEAVGKIPAAVRRCGASPDDGNPLHLER